jgi:AcrR family transcriptional regulator
MLLRMARRSETAAATRRSLLDAAGALLDIGGVDAVTLREVGARAGVSRSAAYRHFADKEALLTVLATNALSELGDTLEILAASDDPPEQSLRSALVSLVTIGRTRPHLYRLMSPPQRVTRLRRSGRPGARGTCSSTSWAALLDRNGRAITAHYC